MSNSTLETQTDSPSKAADATRVKTPPISKEGAPATSGKSKTLPNAVRPGASAKPKKSIASKRGTKTAKILGLLKRPDGASLKELMKATTWQAHSVRGFLSGALRKKMGVRVRSFKRKTGERAYSAPAK